MKKISIALMIALAAIVMAGCIVAEKSGGGDEPGGGGGEVDLILRLRTPGGFAPAARSRALSSDQERAIADIRVLVFDGSYNLLAVKSVEEVEPDEESGTGQFSVTMTPSANKRNLVVVTNLGAIDDVDLTLGALAAQGASLDDVKEALWMDLTGPLYTGPDDNAIPMWGEAAEVTVSSSSTVLPTIDLLRAVARVDVGVGRPGDEQTGADWVWDGLEPTTDGDRIPFEMTSVHVVRSSDRWAVVPDADNIDNKLGALAPTLPPGMEAVDEPLEYTSVTASTPSTGSYITRTIYIPEAEITDLAGDPGDENYTLRPALVVGGKWDALGDGNYTDDEVTYYRVDFAAAGALVDVLRNHLYQFNISRVAGPGAPTVEEAYRQESTNMTVEVLDWNETDMNDIVWVGQQFFAFSERPVEFGAEGGERTVTLRTNIAEGFTMALGGGTLTAPTAVDPPATYSGTNFDYSLTLSGTADGVSTYTLAITATPNFGPGAATRSDNWTIAAGGRLTTPFEVRQTVSLTDPTPYTITLTQTEGGTALSTHESATQGTTVTLLARPDANRRFVRWEFTEGGEAIDPAPTPEANPLAFIMPAAGISVNPVWAVPLPPLPPLPTAPTINDGYILYFDGEGDDARLLLSEWGDGHALNKDTYRTQMAFFKFGSVIGISHSDKENGSVDGASNFELSDIKYNPSTLTIGESGGIQSYSNGTESDVTNANTPPAIPGFRPEHFNVPNNISNVSLEDYHNFANLKIGLGDPCQLVGLTAGEIKAALAVDESAFNALIARRDANAQYTGWRLPTNTENQTFIGNDPGSEDSGSDDSYQYEWTDNDKNAINPSLGQIRVRGELYLPAAGSSSSVGGYVNRQGTYGYFWSSTPHSETNGYNLFIWSSSVRPSNNTINAQGVAVRCVRPGTTPDTDFDGPGHGPGEWDEKNPGHDL